MNLPDEFVRNMRNAFEGEGEKFLKNLPALIDEAAQRWNLTDIAAVDNLSFHFVAFANQRGQDVVLKLGVPNPELTSQIHALRLYDGHGACQLLQADEERGMLVLERLKPGRMLSELKDDEEATAIAAQLALELWEHAPEDAENAKFLSLKGWFDDMQENFHRMDGLLPARFVEKAGSIIRDLFAPPHESPAGDRPQVLLHADYHHYNILESERGWLIIDPKGVIGPPGYEVGPFLINPFDLLERPNPVRITERRIAILAEVLGFEREYVRDWGFAHAVLSDYWCIGDVGVRTEEMFRCAEVIDAAKI